MHMPLYTRGLTEVDAASLTVTRWPDLSFPSRRGAETSASLCVRVHLFHFFHSLLFADRSWKFVFFRYPGFSHESKRSPVQSEHARPVLSAGHSIRECRVCGDALVPHQGSQPPGI
jgi:hypothetical protein